MSERSSEVVSPSADPLEVGRAAMAGHDWPAAFEHLTDANRRGTDYTGMGVHVASRVAALAGADEILATADTLAEAGEVAASDPIETPVRGVAAPVQVAAVSWS